jgi:hypothetical protein
VCVEKREGLDFEAFKSGIAACSRLRGERQIATLFAICKGQPETETIGKLELQKLFALAFQLALAAAKLARGVPISGTATGPGAGAGTSAGGPAAPPRPPDRPSSFDASRLATSALRNKPSLDLKALTAFSFASAPDLGKTLAAFVAVRCLTAPVVRACGPARTDSLGSFSEDPGRALPAWVFSMPRLDAPTAVAEPEDIFALALASSTFQREWNRLYCSDDDGMSFNRLYKAVAGYQGPTLVCIKDTRGAVFGALADNGDQGWREENMFYGSPRSLLFAARPKLRICRSSTSALSGSNFMYLNSQAFDMPHGMGFGGKIDGADFRLWLPEGFDACRAAAQDPTYERGGLCGSRDGSFEIDTIECWGLGGAAALEGRQQKRAGDAAMREKVRKVDKKAMFGLGSDFDKEMFFGKTFAHQKGVDKGRLGCRDAAEADSSDDERGSQGPGRSKFR